MLIRKKMAFETRLVPSLALGGLGSIFITKGLFVTWRSLQHVLQMGMDMGQLPEAPVNVVPAALRIQPTSASQVFRMARKGASCGCMLLTRTGIFYIQPIDLFVFKASPWAPAEGADFLAYQQQSTQLCPKASKMYQQALNQGGTDVELQSQCSHLLLHMLLSDIQNIVRHNFGTSKVQNYAVFQTKAKELIELMKTGGNSKDILTTWSIAIDQAQWTAWLELPKEAFFDNEAAKKNGLAGTVGIQKWDSVDSFQVSIKPIKADWSTKPDIEPNNDKWVNIGRMCYAFKSC